MICMSLLGEPFAVVTEGSVATVVVSIWISPPMIELTVSFKRKSEQDESEMASIKEASETARTRARVFLVLLEPFIRTSCDLLFSL